MKNQYGNYVVRKALSLSTGPIKSKLMHHLKKNLEKLTDNKLITKWQTIINQFTNNSLRVQNNSHQASFGDSFNSSGLNSSFNSNNSYIYQSVSNVTKLSPVIQPDMKSWGSPIPLNRNILNSFTAKKNGTVNNFNNFPTTLNAFEGRNSFDNVNQNFNMSTVNNLNENYQSQMNFHQFNNKAQAPTLSGDHTMRQQKRINSSMTQYNNIPNNYNMNNASSFNNAHLTIMTPNNNFILDGNYNFNNLNPRNMNNNPYNNYSKVCNSNNVKYSSAEQMKFSSQSNPNKNIRK